MIGSDSKSWSDLVDPEAPLARLAARVVFEITERASLHDTEDLGAHVQALRGCGYRVAVDDLGAGYAGLTCFALVNPDIVKLDMALVRGIDRSPTKTKIVASVVALCAELGIVVVVEGVETEAEFRQLRALGCDLQQGYLFARPGRPYPAVAWLDPQLMR